MSKVQIIANHEINYDSWQSAIAGLRYSGYMDTIWLNSISPQGWYGVVWGDYECVFPIMIKKKYGISYACMPPYTQQIDDSKWTDSKWNEAIAELLKRVWLIDICTTTNRGGVSRTNYRLDLSIGVDAVRDNYSKRLRRNLIKFSDVEVGLESYQIHHLDLFLNSDGYWRQVIRHVETFHQTLLALGSHLKVFCAYYHTQPIAQLLAYQMGYVIYLIFPVSSTLGRRCQAMSHLIDYAIEHSGAQILDFEGSSIDHIASFYKQFGAIKEAYSYRRYMRFFD